MLDDVLAPPPAPPEARVAVSDAAGPAVTVEPAARAPLPWWVALLLAAASGAVLLVAFPPYGLWWAAPVGVAMFSAAVYRRRFRTGLLFGAVSGATLFAPLLAWANLHAGEFPWLVLAGLETTYLTLLGGVTAAVSRVADRWWWSYAPMVGVLWVAQEALRDRTPFGGFPWGRLAFSQGESPLLRLAVLGGAPLVTFAVAVTGGLLAAAAFRVRGATPRWVALPAAVAVAVVGLSALVPVASAAGPVVRIAIVQGNVPRLGLDFNAQRRAVLDNHVNGTRLLAAEVAAGTRPRPDLVVWPENASDIDPLINPDARLAIDGAARAVNAPIMVGALLNGPGDHVRNASIVWDPVRGPVSTYIKRHPAPFAEYVPMRQVARWFSTKVDLIRSDFLAGDAVGTMTAGPVAVGAVICFEVAYDDIVRDTVDDGAQVIVVQTNNATFDEAEARQQLAMVRLRAVEHGRPALMASTVGVSAFITTSGEVLDATGFDVPAVISRDVALGSARTMATSLGPAPEITLVAGAMVALGAAWRLRTRPARGQRRAVTRTLAAPDTTEQEG